MSPKYVRRSLLMAVLIPLLLSGCDDQSGKSVADDRQYELSTGKNPHPVNLKRPASAPLSAMAQLGKDIFYDKNLSGSGRMSCASCHDPQHDYGPAGKESVMLGGPKLHTQGARAVPSLMYLYRVPPFSIGPDNEANENTNLVAQASQASKTVHVQKSAANTASSAVTMVPQGGLFWDGRVNTLQQQANGPLFNPAEMDGGSVPVVAQKLKNAEYARKFAQLFGSNVFRNSELLVSEAMFAVARYQVEDPSFHPYSSKFDAWLEGKAKFTPVQMRGYLLFNDPKKGNCAACHVDKPSRTGLPPLLTDHQYEALGVPRNMDIAANRDPHYFDLGVCGPFRSDLKSQTQYCGMFLTPSLRNVATRKVFFHNGVYHSLEDVLKFYDFRDTEPKKIYPVAADGSVEKFDDIPATYQSNVDTMDAPFDRQRGQKPALSDQDMQDIIAFLKTLTDGYQPRERKAVSNAASQSNSGKSLNPANG